MAGELHTDPLFKGLTRPPMLFGVSYKFVVMNAFFNFIYFINTSDFMGLFLFLPGFHAIGYLICHKEPLFVELFVKKIQRCNKCKNRMYHGYTNSYDAF